MINSYCRNVSEYGRRLGVILLLAVLGACASSSEAPRGKTAHPRSESAAANEVVLFALGLLNTGYRFGGSNPESGLDCSGMTAYIFREALGMNLPHNAQQQSRLGKAVGRDQLLAGDLVFFNTNGSTISHVGLYIGENRFVHAPATNGRIKITPLDNVYFKQRYVTARRLLN